MSSIHRAARRRFVPDPRIIALVARYGAPQVGLMYGLDGNALRRYVDGASQRTTRWWIELNAEVVARDLLAQPTRPVLRALASTSAPPGEGT